MGSVDVPKFVRDRMKEQIQNGKKPTESNVPSFVKKKDETVSEDSAIPAPPTSDPSQPGTEITPQSPSQLPSENGAATPKIDFREGLKFQEQPQSKKPAIFSIAELARQQNNDDNIILASVIPKTFPENQPNNIVAENTKNSKEKDVLAGNADAITSVIQREQQKLEKQKNDAKNNLSGIQKAQGYGAQGSELYDKSVELRAEVELLRATQLQLLNDGVETINKVYAKKFEDSPDKSVIVQNALGNELRSQQAKIGGDLLYTDEKSIADRLPDYEKVMSAPGASSSPIKNVLQQRLDLVRKTNQQLEFTNRATLLNATYENSFEQLQDLSKEPEVQQGLSGTPERQAALADNPKVVQAKKLMDDFKSTGAQMDNLVNQYPEVKAQRQAQQVSDLYADYIVRAEKGEYGAIEKLAAGRNLVEGKRLNDDYEIKRIVEASKGTLTEDEVRKYADNASIPSFVGNFLRGFGTSFKDTEQGLNRLLMTKSEADIRNTLIEQSKYHAPEALQGYSNVNNIVSTMFSGTGNIVGLGVQGLVGGEIIGAAAGLSKLARLSKTALNALQTAEQVLPTTKLADFMVTLGAAETKEQALAQILGAATKAKNMAGVYGSIYLPTYEGAYQEAAIFTSDEDKRNEYASDVANANGVAMLFLNPPSLVGKIIKPVPFGTKEVFKSQLEHVGKTLVSAAPATMIPLVQETISKDDIFDYHTSASTFINESLDRTLHMAVSVLPLGILGAARMQSSKMLKSSLYEAGKQREQMNERVEELFNKGEITNEEKNRQISVINTLSNLVHNTPEKNNEGKELTQEKKNDLVYLQMQNAALRAKQENVSEDIKPHYEQEIKENTSAIKEIMQPKEEKAAEATQPEVVSNEVVEKVKYGDVIKYGDENSKEATVIFINPTSVILRKSNPREIEGNEIGVPIILNEKGEVLDGNNRVKHSLDKGIKSIPAVTINRESISEKELKNLVNVLRYKYSTLNQLPAKEIMQAKEENPSEESTKEPEVTHDEDLIPDSRQSKVNELIEQVRYYNSLRKNAVNKAQSLNEIRLAANELGLNFVNKKGYGILRNEAGNRVQTRSSQTNASEAVDFKEENYSPQTKDQIKNILTDDSPLVGLPIKGEDGFRLSDRQKQAALKSIQAGKPTKGAKAIYDFIEGAVKDGNIEIEDKTTGQAVKVPVDEYFEMFKEPAKELTDEQIIELNTELGEQAFNEIFDNALNEGYENSSRRNVSEVEQANEAAAGENPQTPLSGKSNEQVSSETSQENTRVTKPITINVSEEKSSQGGEESRQESGQTRQEGNEENVGSQPIAENQGGATGSGGPPLTSNEFMEVSGEEAGPQRRFTQQMLRSDELSEAAKGEISKTLDYSRQTNEMSLKEANDVIDTVGLSEAQSFVMNDGDLKPAVRVTLSQILIKKYSELALKSEDENTKNYYLDKAIQTASFVTEKLGTEAGQSIQAFSMWSRLSPEGQLRAANQDMARQGKEKLRRREKDIKVIGDKFKKANEDAAEEITNSPKVKEAAKKEDSKRVSKAKDKIAAAKTKREQIIKKYKGEKGKGLYSSPTGLTKEGIEFVGDLVATYVQEGIANLEIIVDKVLSHLKEVSGKATNDEVKKNVSDIVGEAIGKKEDKAIAGGLSELESEIGNIVREHYTVPSEAKTSLINKFIDRIGLEKEEAEKLSKDIADEFDRIATRKKRDILYNEKARFDKINNTLAGAKKPEPKTVQSDIIKYSNLGAFDAAEFADLVASKFGLGEIAPEQAAKLIELANKVQNAPEGSPKNNATEDLLNYRAKLRGNDLGETVQAVWYSNVLSGYKTHEKNLVSTFFNSMAELGAEMFKDPKAIPYIFAGYAKGLSGRGRVEAVHTLKTGRSPIHIKKIETPNVLERKGFMGGGFNPANWFKYVMRLMVAEDVLSFQGLKEARSYQLARRDAQNEGYNTWSKKGWDRVNEILLHTKDRMKEADEQATQEGMKGLEKKRRVYELMENSRPTKMTEDAYGFAAHGTFNHESEGSLGAITNVVASAMDAVSVGGVKPLRFIVPFTRIITNVVNNSLDFTPVGFIRGARGVRGFRSFEENRFTKGAFKELDKGERQRLIAKAAIGVSLTTALQALHQAGVIQITGAGPDDPKKKQQLMGEGWQPYSIKVGDKYYSYQYTPMVFMTGFLGNMNDAAEYGGNDEQSMLKRVQIAGSRIGGQVVDMTWINSASTFLGALAESNPNTQSKQLSNVFGNTVKGFVPFSGALTQTSQLIQNEFQMPQKQVNGAFEALIQDIPIARNGLNDKINALGDPVVRDNDVVLSAETKDPVWKYLLDHNGWVAPVNKNTIIVFDPELRMDRPVTNDEYYEFSKLRGQKIKEGIKTIMANGATVVNPKEAVTKTADELTEGELNILLTDIEGDATKAAKRELFQPKEKKRTKIFVNPKNR